MSYDNDLTCDRRHEEHCAACEFYQDGREAYWDEFESEDLLVNLANATGVDREVILELLEVRGMAHENGGWIDSVQRDAAKNEAAVYDRIDAMTDTEIRDKSIQNSWHSCELRTALLIATGRLILPCRRKADAVEDLETVDVLAAEAKLTRPFAGIARDLVQS